MKTFYFSVTLLLAVSSVNARDFGVSSSSAGRGTKYTTSRGGSAYVGPRGAAAQGADGRTAVAGRYGGAAVAGPNGAAAVGRYGGAAVAGPNGAAAVGRYGGAVAVSSSSTYIRTVPTGSRAVFYGGYNCYFAAGVYYRPIMYQGATVYVVVP